MPDVVEVLGVSVEQKVFDGPLVVLMINDIGQLCMV